MAKERPTITRYICPVFNTKLEDKLEHKNMKRTWEPDSDMADFGIRPGN